MHATARGSLVSACAPAQPVVLPAGSAAGGQLAATGSDAEPWALLAALLAFLGALGIVAARRRVRHSRRQSPDPARAALLGYWLSCVATRISHTALPNAAPRTRQPEDPP
ncbi:hypothetical protein B7R21_15035 [Subtercola boreus]|uniref:Gram-positive cocci surface proteins LPxTG domain-containing protein n=1 Tax=Subtercola boreus TaxID=120213 RepID=A0A3E0VC92_9MICO|nr:LPXTG cell wall anchor domain-containing protein [Subtercola boreus]RFA07502.1 hypothetical protein B7R21_15035 [Subtercola boreus]